VFKGAHKGRPYDGLNPACPILPVAQKQLIFPRFCDIILLVGGVEVNFKMRAFLKDVVVEERQAALPTGKRPYERIKRIS